MLAQGVIPSQPDAWIWAGDFAYLDNPPLSCDTVPGQPECQCNATWLQAPPNGCMAGDLPHAVRRWNAQVIARRCSSPVVLLLGLELPIIATSFCFS